jgi:hypothetical protein
VFGQLLRLRVAQVLRRGDNGLLTDEVPGIFRSPSSLAMVAADRRMAIAPARTTRRMLRSPFPFPVPGFGRRDPPAVPVNDSLDEYAD